MENMNSMICDEGLSGTVSGWELVSWLEVDLLLLLPPLPVVSCGPCRPTELHALVS